MHVPSTHGCPHQAPRGHGASQGPPSRPRAPPGGGGPVDIPRRIPETPPRRRRAAPPPWPVGRCSLPGSGDRWAAGGHPAAGWRPARRDARGTPLACGGPRRPAGLPPGFLPPPPRSLQQRPEPPHGGVYTTPRGGGGWHRPGARAPSMAWREPAARPVVAGRAHVAGRSGTGAGPWLARPSCSWPAPFPPRLPPSSASLEVGLTLPWDSGAVRRPAPVPHGRAPAGCAVRAWGRWTGQVQGLPGPAHKVSVPARGRRPRQVRGRLAVVVSPLGPAACAERVGTQEEPDVGAPYPACTFPGQRFTDSVTEARA
jgi:hypothetical protein